MSRGPLKAWIFLTIISIIWIFGGYIFLDRQGLLLGVGLALGINSFVFFYGDLRPLSLFRGVRLEGQDPWGLTPMLKRMSAQIKIPLPEIYILDISTPQAFCVGRSQKGAKVGLTRGLVDQLKPKELEAVLAVLLKQIEHLDIFAFQVAAALSDGLLMTSATLDRMVSVLTGSGQRGAQNGVFSRAFGIVAASLIRLIVPAQGYLLADRQAAEWLGDSRRLAEVLWKLGGYAATQELVAPPFTSHMFIVNPLTSHSRHQYFHVQPSPRKRIENLLGYFPL